jgi:hypothetical protein
MSRTSIPVSEAAILTLLLEQPDMPDSSYNELAGSLTSPQAIQIAKEIRQQGGRAAKTSAASRTGTKKPVVSARAKKAAAAGKQTTAKKAAAAVKQTAAKKAVTGAKKTAAKPAAKKSVAAKSVKAAAFKQLAMKSLSRSRKLYLAS